MEKIIRILEENQGNRYNLENHWLCPPPLERSKRGKRGGHNQWNSTDAAQRAALEVRVYGKSTHQQIAVIETVTNHEQIQILNYNLLTSKLQSKLHVTSINLQ